MTHAVITLDHDVAEAELDELVGLLDAAGLDAEVGPARVRMGSLRDTAVQMVIQGPIDVVIAALTTAAGKRAWRFITGLLDRHRDGHDRDDGHDRGHRSGRHEADGSTGRQIVAVIVAEDGADRIELSRTALRAATLDGLPARLARLPADRTAVVVRWDAAAGTWQVSVTRPGSAPAT